MTARKFQDVITHQAHRNGVCNGGQPGHLVKEVQDLCPSAAKSKIVQEELTTFEYNLQCSQRRVKLAATRTERLWTRIKDLVTLTALFSTFFASVYGAVLLCGLNILRAVLFKSWRNGAATNYKGTVIVTGGRRTKSLHVCRHLYRAGWRVVMVEVADDWLALSRLSRSVDRFYTVTSYISYPAAYIKEIAEIAAKEQADYFVPGSDTYSLIDALVADVLPAHCKPWTLDPELSAVLDNKARFSELCQMLGLSVPPFFKITSKQQLMELNAKPEAFKGRRYILKSICYDSIIRNALITLPMPANKLSKLIEHCEISTVRPWILQRFITGPEYSCFSILHKGHVVAHADNKASLSCLNYKHIANPDIEKWVKDFAAATDATGQVCFDFMRDEADGQLYAIECNPRMSSNITGFHTHPYLGLAWTQPEAVPKTLTPIPNTPITYWFWHEVAMLLLTGNFPRFWAMVTQGMDAVFDPEDPLPFFVLHYLQIPRMLLQNLWTGNPWVKVDLCIGEIFQLGG